MLENIDSKVLFDSSTNEININTDTSNPNHCSIDSRVSVIEPVDLQNRLSLSSSNPQSSPKRKEKFTIVEVMLFLMAISLLIVAIAYLVIYNITETIPTLFDNNSFNKSFTDNKAYKIIKLLNGIDITLVSDEKTSTPAMSITLNVGSLNENPQRPGIAALARRLMILKTTKDTNLTDFNNYLALHFGLFQSKVNDSMTSLYFSIGKEGFYHASVLFTDFFKYPKIDEADLKRELEAVYKEYNTLRKDFYCVSNIIEHKIVYALDSYFPYGSPSTLSQANLAKIKQEVGAYIKNNFISNNIKVVLLGSNSIDELKGIAIKLFGDVPSKASSKATPYPSQIASLKRDDLRLGQLIYLDMGGVSELRAMFYLNKHQAPQSEFYLKYLTYLFRDRKVKSIATTLRQANLISNLTTGYEVISEHFIKFTISLRVNWGLEDHSSIVEYLFNYLRIIRDTTDHLMTYKDMELIFKKNYSFKSNPIDYLEFTRNLNQHMFAYNERLNLLLFESDYLPPYNEEILRFYIDQFRSENAVILYGNPRPPSKLFEVFSSNPFVLESLKTEKYFETKYAYDSIKHIKLKELNEMKRYDEQLALRGSNAYITSLNNIKEVRADHKQFIAPVKLFASNHVNLWHNYDISFQIPKIHAHYQIITQFLRDINDYSKFLSQMYFYYLKEVIEEEFSEAKDAGNEVFISKTENGYQLTLSCYSDLFTKLNAKVIPVIFNPSIKSKSLFERLKAIAREKENRYDLQTIQRVSSYFKELMKNNFSASDISHSSYQMEQYNRIANNVRDISINALYYGDINSTESLQLFNSAIVPNINLDSIQIEIKWQLFSTQTINAYLNEHVLTEGSYAFVTDSIIYSDLESIVVNYFKVGPYTQYTDAITSLILSIWQDQFVDIIKLKRSDVTLVKCKRKVIDSTVYFVFTAAMRGEVIEVNKEMDLAIGEIYRRLFIEGGQDVTLLYYDAIQNYLNLNEEKDFSLWERSNRVFNAILQERQHYDKGSNYTQDKIKKEMGLKTQLKEFFYSVFYSEVRKLSIRVNPPLDYEDFYGVKADVKNESYVLNTNITTYASNDQEKVRKWMKNPPK